MVIERSKKRKQSGGGRRPIMQCVIGLAVWLVLSIPTQAAIEVFTTKSFPVAVSHEVTVYYLDAADELEQALFVDLSSDPRQAEIEAKARFNQPDWQAQQAKLIEAYEGILQAFSLKLEKVPAVVFDRQFVIYGTTDITQATQLWEHYRENQ